MTPHALRADETGGDPADMTSAAPLPDPVQRRVRHDLRRRELTVTEAARLTPHMIRLTLEGEDMADFPSLAPDDHVMIFIPGPDGSSDGTEERRAYTPRSFDREARRLVLDFALHEAGPATAWAMRAAPGDRLAMGGPRGSRLIEGPVRDWLLIGDETALPAIGRRVEELGADARVAALVAIPGPEDAQDFATPAALRAHWVHRPEAQATDPAPLLDALRLMPIGPETFVWIAAEAGVARALRTHMLEERGHSPRWLFVAGYWVTGEDNRAIGFE